MQFWANAPYAHSLQRLHRINRSRVTAHVRAELRALVPEERRETLREALQCYMDGVWLEAAQSDAPLNAALARKEAREVVDLMLQSHS